MLKRQRHGSQITVERSDKIQSLLDNIPLQEKLLSLIESHGSYKSVIEKKKLTAVARELHEWCKRQSDVNTANLSDFFSGTAAGNVVKELCIFRAETSVTSNIRLRSTRAQLVDRYGEKHKIFKLSDSLEINAQSRCYIVGQESLDDLPSVVKEEEGRLFVYWGDQKLDLFTLACDRRYSYVGNLVEQPNATRSVLVRHIDARVAIRMYRMYECDLWLDIEKGSTISLDMTTWLDGSKVDKSGRSDTCMQLIADPRYMKTDDKQKAVIRSPISVGMTWESETTNGITSLCAVLVQI